MHRRAQRANEMRQSGGEHGSQFSPAFLSQKPHGASGTPNRTPCLRVAFDITKEVQKTLDILDALNLFLERVPEGSLRETFGELALKLTVDFARNGERRKSEQVSAHRTIGHEMPFPNRGKGFSINVSRGDRRWTFPNKSRGTSWLMRVFAQRIDFTADALFAVNGE